MLIIPILAVKFYLLTEITFVIFFVVFMTYIIWSLDGTFDQNDKDKLYSEI